MRGALPSRGPLVALVVALLVAAAASRSAAQDALAAAQRHLAVLDADRDGLVARSEWPGSGASFLTLDVDLDGALSLAELARQGSPLPPPSPSDRKLAADTCRRFHNQEENS